MIPPLTPSLNNLLRCSACRSADLLWDGTGYKCAACAAYNTMQQVEATRDEILAEGTKPMIPPPTRLTPERLSELRRSLDSGWCLELFAHIDALSARLAAVEQERNQIEQKMTEWCHAYQDTRTKLEQAEAALAAARAELTVIYRWIERWETPTPVQQVNGVDPWTHAAQELRELLDDVRDAPGDQ